MTKLDYVFILTIKLSLIILTGYAINSFSKPTIDLSGQKSYRVYTHVDLTKTSNIFLKDEVQDWNIDILVEQLEARAPFVNLIINSPGGYVSSGLKLVNKIESLRAQGKLKKLKCYVLNMAASMAAIISGYCDELYIHKFAMLMHHEASYGVRGSVSEIRKQVEVTDQMLNPIFDDLARRYGLSGRRTFWNFIGSERWFNAHDAGRYGLVDGTFQTLYHETDPPKKPKTNGFFDLFGHAIEEIEI